MDGSSRAPLRLASASWFMWDNFETSFLPPLYNLTIKKRLSTKKVNPARKGEREPSRVQGKQCDRYILYSFSFNTSTSFFAFSSFCFICLFLLQLNVAKTPYRR